MFGTFGPRRRSLSAFCLVVSTILLTTFAPPASAQFYKQDNLVSDIPGLARITDSSLVNPWGMSHSSASPIWTSNQGTNTATLYSINGITGVPAKVGLTVSVPGGPTGQLFNSTTDFRITNGGGTNPALFIFATLSGRIFAWNGGSGTNAQLVAAGAPPPAVYTGLAMATNATGPHLYAANVAAGRIDVFDKTFAQVALSGNFTDPALPAGNKPFNVASIGGMLFVTYQGPSGIVNVFDVDGNFVKRFTTGGALINPWGMALTPSDFGLFSNALLIGNFNFGDPAVGAGLISAYDPNTGAFLGLLKNDHGDNLTVDGLWTLLFGNGGNGGISKLLYLSAGIQKEAHGLVASLSPCHGPVVSAPTADPSVIWPPNHKMVPVTVDYTVSDDCDPNPVCTLTVSSNEPVSNGQSDWQVLDAHHLLVRAERLGTGNGRVYTITVTCIDRMGLSTQKTVTVTVPHDQGH